MTGNLDPGTATRAALGEEIDRLREVARVALVGLERAEADIKAIEEQRDEARRDLAAATTALQRIRKLCVGRRTVATDAIHAVLAAAGDGPATTGGETDGQ